jgi:hypothetical protein
MDAIRIFNEYKNLGYHLIPLHKGTKKPIMKNWNKKYSYKRIESFLLQNPGNYNFGILLGDVIDIEGDSLEANIFLNDTLKDIPHAIYQSSKSTHHLFRMGSKFFTRHICNGIEFRGYGHQSVVPPSTHENGAKYTWITDKIPANQLPVLPPELELKIKTFKKRSQKFTKPHNKKIKCFACEKFCFINKRRLDLELSVLRSIGHKWMCNPCRPYDLRENIRNLRKLITQGTALWSH